MLPTFYTFCYLPAVPLWCRKPQHAVAEVSCLFGFYHGKSQRCAFPFDNMQPFVAIQKGLFAFFPLQQKISTQRRRVRNLCNRWVFFVNLAKLQCRCAKILFAMFAVQERKTTNFYTTSVVYAICATVGCLLCQFVKIAMQMHKNFLCDVCRVREKNHKFLHNAAVYAIRATVGCFLSIWQNCNADAEKFCLQCLPCNREKPQNPPFMAFICVKSTHLTVNMV